MRGESAVRERCAVGLVALALLASLACGRADGPAPVAWAEDVAYGVQDRYNRWRYKDAAPKRFWRKVSGELSKSRYGHSTWPDGLCYFQ